MRARILTHRTCDYARVARAAFSVIGESIGQFDRDKLFQSLQILTVQLHVVVTSSL